MAGLMSRSRGMAEGVVVMVCPVLLALALDKVDLKVYGHRAFMAMLTMAGVTLISGICPVLVFCFSQRFLDDVNPAPVTTSLATLSYCCLLILACFIAKLIVSLKILITVGALCGGFILVRTAFYCLGQTYEPYNEQDLHDILDESHEFLTGVTGILFLGLEGLALESHGDQMFPNGGGAVSTISFIVCALGVCVMYFEMTPPLNFNEETWIVGFTMVLDILMAAGTFVLLMVAMFKLMGVPALVLFTPPVVIIGELVYRVAADVKVDTPASNVPASLELTKVTFTGFLAVAITAISNTSHSKLTACFLLFAAGAIVFGISWRLLTQAHMRTNGLPYGASPDKVASSANLASFGTHFCIVIATILFLAMAGKATGK